MKFKKSILIGLILTTPLVAYASNKQVSISNKQINLAPANLEASKEDTNKKKILQNEEGAISNYEAEKLTEKLIKRESGEIKFKINPNKNNNIKKSAPLYSNKENKITLKVKELDSLIKISFSNLIEINNSKILETDSGWQIILQVPEERTINISNSTKNPKYYTDIEVNKFNKSTYIISVINKKDFKLNKPFINNEKDLSIDINVKNIKNKIKKFTIPFLRKFKKRNSVYTKVGSAEAPPVGDIASGSVLLKNRGFIQLKGPEVSLTLNNASAKDALMKLAKLGGYGFVLANEGNSKNSSKDEELNSGPKVTLSFIDEDYSVAFNSVLLASGMQAKRNQNLIIVGKNVLGKSFGPQLSKVYRLNQTTASAAADYLATLGASITKVDTVASSDSGEASSKDNGVKYIDSYSASTGPLNGLFGTTDSRLQTITLVGPSELILIAEKYLKQLDLRQRQVALTVKILDVELTDTDSISNDLAFRTGSTFIVNEKGKLFSAFGNYIPGSLSSGGPAETRTFSESTNIDNLGNKTTTTALSTAIGNQVIPNPGFQYTANQLYNFLAAQMRKTSTKVLANPTLILSESSEEISGGAAVVGSIGGGVSSIGRPYANESFITLGTNVITDYATSTSSEGGATTCKASFSTAGLTFGARINKIDDNGYVTFSLSPKFTSISEIIDIPNCGPINILSVRRLDTGKLRVKDSQTLILTGVISELDGETISKTPILGDIPILGRLFKSTSGSKRKSELVILVTPKIINDTEIDNFKLGYEPTNESKKIIKK